MSPKTARECLPGEVPDAEPPRADPQAREGTQIMPMPKVGPKVAGMPRDGRTLTEPGDPGVIAGEDDILDTSHLPPPGKEKPKP